MSSRPAAFLIACLTLAALLAAVAPNVTAQGSGPAFVWIYSQESGRLVQVAPGGLPSDEIAYPLPPDVPEPPYNIAFSRDARYLAGCLRDAAGSVSVRVFDFSSQSYVAAYHFPGTIVECSLARYAFSEDGSTLAFGVLNHYPFDGDTRPSWELMVMDVASGSIVHHLASDAPQVAALGVEDTGKLPIVVTYEQTAAGSPGVLTFMPVQWATEGMCEYPSLVWNLADDSVLWEGPYGHVGFDMLLGSGEAVWVERDDTLPAGQLDGPGCAYNLAKYRTSADEIVPLFHNGTVLSGSTFADDGRRILVNSYEHEVGTWIALERDGTTTAMPGVNSFQVWGTPTGYVFVDSAQPTSPNPVQEVRFHHFRGGPVPEVDVAWRGEPGDYWRVVWAPPLAGAPNLPPFAPGTPLSPDAAREGPRLGVGGRAQVQTTGGDQLRVRSGPGLANGIVFHLQNGMQVAILEGPTSADGLVWWRVESEGRAGWAVEGIQEAGGYLTTLVPVP